MTFRARDALRVELRATSMLVVEPESSEWVRELIEWLLAGH